MTDSPITRETDGHALALAIAKLAGLHECPHTPNTVCVCAPGWCLIATVEQKERENG